MGITNEEEQRKALQALIACPLELSAAVKRVREFPSDSELELVQLRLADILRVLSRFRSDRVPAAHVQIWADALEVRDDIAYESDSVVDLLFRLATPEINDPITTSLADSILREHGETV